MPVPHTVTCCPLGLLLAFSAALAAEPGPSPPAAPVPKMQMDAPMQGGMMKEGMKKGDVKRAAARKGRAMKPVMEREEKSMPPAAGRP